METDNTRKTYVVTGASSGIGFAVTEKLLNSGASVIGIGRSRDHCIQAERQLTKRYTNNMVEFLVGDLSEQQDVRRMAAEIRSSLSNQGKTTLDGLVNNAGIFTYWFTQTSAGIEMQWAVNHIAPFLLTNEMLPLL